MSNNKVNLACLNEVQLISIKNLLPTRKPSTNVRKSPKFLCIQASIRELGLIEPLVVYPQKGSEGVYVILDGHIRYSILRDLGVTVVKCLVSTDDESFTFNHKVNRLTPIQEHFMIAKAVKNGVSEERIARTLNVDVSTINQKRDLLDGVCTEAISLLKDKRTPARALRELRKVHALRQIEIAELMNASGNYSNSYMKCLIMATPRSQRNDEFVHAEDSSADANAVDRINRESHALIKDLKAVEESHGKNVLNLVIIAGYLRKLLDNARVVRFLLANNREILEEFQKIVEIGQNDVDACGVA